MFLLIKLKNPAFKTGFFITLENCFIQQSLQNQSQFHVPYQNQF